MNLRRRSLLLFVAVLVLGICPLMAANITYTFNGTLGPVLSGSDPLGGNGQSGTVTAVASTTLVPTSHTMNTATYTLPAGAVTLIIGGTSYPTTGTTSMKVNISGTGPNNVQLTTTVTVFGIKGTVVATAALAPKSFGKAVLSHPTKFNPPSQTLKAAASATGPGSKVKYTALGSSTVLGLAGTATN